VADEKESCCSIAAGNLEGERWGAGGCMVVGGRYLKIWEAAQKNDGLVGCGRL
jgi:hypothetical protein